MAPAVDEALQTFIALHKRAIGDADTIDREPGRAGRTTTREGP